MNLLVIYKKRKNGEWIFRVSHKSKNKTNKTNKINKTNEKS